MQTVSDIAIFHDSTLTFEEAYLSYFTYVDYKTEFQEVRQR